MQAAVGRTCFASLPARVGRLHVALCAALMSHGPCWAQDTAIVGVDLMPSMADQVHSLKSQDAFQPASTAVPRVSFTLGTPLLMPGAPAGSHALDLGVQWRQPMPTGRSMDITAWRRMTPDTDAITMIQQRDPVYGARVEINLQGRKRGLVADRRFIGLQLDSGARITLRRKDGNPVLYYRSHF